MASSRVSTATRPRTGPKYSVRWNCDPARTPTLIPGVHTRPSASRRRGSSSHSSPGASTVRASSSLPVAGATRGPNTVAGSVVGPTCREVAASTTCLRNRSSVATGPTRIPRLAAEHFWPWWPNAERTRSAAARSRSAWAVTTRAFLPLASAKSLMFGSQQRNRSAVSCEPVRITPSTVVTSRRPTSSSGVRTNLSTSAGTPAAQQASATISAQRGVSGAGLNTTALPAASAASVPPAGMATGKFHGGITATTPSGVKSAPSMRSSSVARSAYQRAKSTASPISGSASATVLDASCIMARSRSSCRATSSSATRRSTSHLSEAPRAAHSAWAARAVATSASIPSIVEVSVVRTGSNSLAASASSRRRVAGSVGSPSGWFRNRPPPFGGTSASRRGRSPTFQRPATAARKHPACSSKSGVPGRRVNRWWRKFSSELFSSRRRKR